MRLSSVAFVFPDLRYCNIIITKKKLKRQNNKVVMKRNWPLDI